MKLDSHNPWPYTQKLGKVENPSKYVRKISLLAVVVRKQKCSKNGNNNTVIS